MKLILVRHGQTSWNLKRRYCGFTDIKLDKKGIRQAKKILKRLKKEKIHAAYSSDMKRAIQTAKIALNGKPFVQLSGLREMNFGVFEGLTYREIMSKYPKIYKKWISNPSGITMPKGESFNKLTKRVKKEIRKLNFNNNKTIAIFTHAGPIRVILCRILKLSSNRIWEVNPKSASISIIKYINGKGKIIKLNDTSHLNG